MERIDETVAAETFVKNLEDGVYPLERAKNCGINYSETKEGRDTEAVRQFTKSNLFQEIKQMM